MRRLANEVRAVQRTGKRMDRHAAMRTTCVTAVLRSNRALRFAVAGRGTANGGALPAVKSPVLIVRPALGRATQRVSKPMGRAGGCQRGRVDGVPITLHYWPESFVRPC